MNLDNRIKVIVVAVIFVAAILTISMQPNVYARSAAPAFVLTALLKLKADKDNPIQIPIGVAEFRHDLQDFLSSLRK